MELVFNKVLTMSISASWLVLAVLLLRLLLKKSPKWISVALWALVALRLVVPVSLESGLSLMPEKTTEQMVQTISGGYYGDTMIYSRGSENYDVAVSAGVTPEAGDGGYQYVLNQSGDPTEPVQTVAVLYGQIWVLGLILMALHAFVSYVKLKKKVSASLDLGNGVHLCDYIDTPFILGIFCPKIYLPSSMEPDSASYVVAHERAHIARKDHWWKPFGYLLLSVHWFNPVLWLAYILLCRDIELACDEKVIRDMERPQKKAYSEALLNCSVSRRMIAACPLAFGEVGVKERVKTVLNYKKPAFWLVLVAVFALIVTAVCFLTDPVVEDEAFDKLYQVEKVVYQNPVLSVYMTEADAPLVQVAGDGELLVQHKAGQWESAGMLEEVEISVDDLPGWFFGLSIGWEDAVSLEQISEKTETVWMVKTTDAQRPGHMQVWILLRLSNGKMYLADAYDTGEGTKVNWFYRLKDTALTEGENLNTPFGNYYRIRENVYRDVSVGSYAFSSYNVYLLTPGRGLSEMEHMGESGRSIARFTPVELTKENFVDFIVDKTLGEQLLTDNYMAWEYYGSGYPNPQLKGSMYLLQQRDGQIYIATGIDENGERRIGYVFAMEMILSDDPLAESESPYQWTWNLELQYVEAITVKTHDGNGTPMEAELPKYEQDLFALALNGVERGAFALGNLSQEPYIWAQIVYKGEIVTLAYDKNAVSITFPESAASRYPQEAGKTWIITDEALNDAMYAFHCYDFRDSPYSYPDNAYHWCQKMYVSLVEYAVVGDVVNVDNRYNQAYGLPLDKNQIGTLLKLLKNIPEGQFELAELPEEINRSIAISCWDMWGGNSHWVKLYLSNGEIYYQFFSREEDTNQVWKVNSQELKDFANAYYTVEYSYWEKYAPQMIVEGEISLEADGETLLIPQLAAFEYDITDEGIRFKPEDQSGWVLLKYLTEPFGVCGTGLRTLEGSYGGNPVVMGYYDENQYWSYVVFTVKNGEEEYPLLFLNEEGAAWVEEYWDELDAILRDIQLRDKA